MQTDETSDKPRFAPETLGRRLASARELRGITQDAAAQAIGVTRQYVWMLEADKHTPSVSLLVKLAALYDVTETWLLHGERQTVAA